MKSIRNKWVTVVSSAFLLGCSGADSTPPDGVGIDPETDSVPLEEVIETAGLPDITHGTGDFAPLAISNLLQDRTFVAFLSGGQEVPGVTTEAFGSVALVLNGAGNKLKFIMRHAVNDSTVAHLHNAAAGENGPIIVALPNANKVSAGTVTITKEQAAELRAGRLYVNVHSKKNPMGEVRGQILRPGETLFTAALSGVEEVPRNESTSSAVASLILSPARDQVRFRVRVTGFTPTAAHIHRGIVGVNGPIVYPLLPLGALIEGVQAIKASDIEDLTRRQWYFNVHSAANPMGEVRGQIVRPGETFFGATLTSAQELPPSLSTSTNTGNGMILLGMAGSKFWYQLITSATPTAVHIHRANGGLNGPIEVPLAPISQNMFGIEDLGTKRAADVTRGLWYFNVHTKENPNGDIRGQVLKPGETLFTAILSGKNEVPPTTSTATGGVGIILNAARTEFRYDGAATDLVPTLAHIHDNVAGMNGPILFPLTLSGSSVSGNQVVNAAQVTKLANAGLYVNLHSMEFPMGAVRGQITVPTLAKPAMMMMMNDQSASGIVDSAPNFQEPDGSVGVSGKAGECITIGIAKTGSFDFVSGTMTMWSGANCNIGKSFVISDKVSDFGAIDFLDQLQSVFIGDNDKTPPSTSAILDSDKNMSDANGSEGVSGPAGSCQNLSQPKSASSITNTGRLTLFDGANCAGKSVIITGNVKDLGALGFDNRAVSVLFK